MGSRGINYNQEKFTSKMNLKYLKEGLVMKFLMPFFHQTLHNLIKSLINTEAGHSLLEPKVIQEYKKIMLIKDKWESLKKLATLPF